MYHTEQENILTKKVLFFIIDSNWLDTLCNSWCVVLLPIQLNKPILSLFLLWLKKKVFSERSSFYPAAAKKCQTHLSIFSSLGQLLCSFQSATWCWSPATLVTCLAVWTGSSSRYTQLKITWWSCMRQRWPLNQNEVYLELTHRENRPSRGNTDINKQQQTGMKMSLFTWTSSFNILYSVYM